MTHVMPTTTAATATAAITAASAHADEPAAAAASDGADMPPAALVDSLPRELIERICELAGPYTCWRNSVRPYCVGPGRPLSERQQHEVFADRLRLSRVLPRSAPVPVLDVEPTLAALAELVGPWGDRHAPRDQPVHRDPRVDAEMLLHLLGRAAPTAPGSALVHGPPASSASALGAGAALGRRLDVLFARMRAGMLGDDHRALAADRDRLAPMRLWLGLPPGVPGAPAAPAGPLAAAELAVVVLRGHLDLLRRVLPTPARMRSLRPDTAMMLHRGVVPAFLRDRLLGPPPAVLACLRWLDKDADAPAAHGAQDAQIQPPTVLPTASVGDPRVPLMLLANALSASNFDERLPHAAAVAYVSGAHSAPTIDANCSAMAAVLSLLASRVPITAALEAACRWGRVAMLELLRHAITPCMVSHELLRLALDGGHRDVAVFLYALSAPRAPRRCVEAVFASPVLAEIRFLPIASDAQPAVVRCARDGCFDDLANMLASPSRDALAPIVLLYASAYGRLDVVQQVFAVAPASCQHGRDGDAADACQMPNALDLAARFGHLPTAKWLYANTPIRPTSAAITGACENAQEDMVEWLASLPAASCNSTALACAAKTGCVEVVSLLVRKFAEVVAPQAGLAVDLAAERGFVSVLLCLLDSFPVKTSYRATLAARANGFLLAAECLRARSL